MALTPRLDLRQSQQLVMTPQLQQAIKLLQLSNLELAEYVAQEIERNPLLDVGEPGEPPVEHERGEGGGTASSDDLRETSSDGFDTSLTGDDGWGEAGEISADQPFETGLDTGSLSDSALDTNYDETTFHHDSAHDNATDLGLAASSSGLSLDGGSTGSGNSFNGEDRSLDQTLEDSLSLNEHLAAQVPIILLTPLERLIGSHLVDMVDEAGYVPKDSTADIAERLDCSEADVEACLIKLQGCDPTGVFARSLSECLALQLIEQDRYDPAMQTLIENLDMVAKGELVALRKMCGVDSEDFTEMMGELRSLNPKPGLIYGYSDVTPVVPDVFVRRGRDGSWVVELNTDTLPRVLMNNHYLSELNSLPDDKETRSFVSECQSGANWLMKALDQRARTILKVASALVKTQHQFFEHGVRFLKPMTLRDIADEIDMHESTVSRVTSNKFLSCSRGMFELKYFFSSAISAADGGDALSAEAVKYRIKELIDGESPKKILSDDKLVAILKGEGMDIARRTVAKYREALKIASSVQRRRQKNMG